MIEISVIQDRAIEGSVNEGGVIEVERFVRLSDCERGRRGAARAGRWLGCVGLWVCVTACGHLGVDLDGADASVRYDAERDKDADSETKPDKTESNSDKTETKDDSNGSDESTTDVSIGLSGMHTSSDVSESKTDSGVAVSWDADLDASPDAALDGSLDAALDASDASGGSTFDATVDASEPASDADWDATDALSSDTGTQSTDDTAIPIPDDNAYTCDPTCQCAAEEVCELECHLPECSATCAEAAQCLVHTGESTTVTVECAEGATCDASGTAPVVHAICKGPGECQVACGGTQKCDIDCAGTGTCTAVCMGNATCHVNCGADAKCYVNHVQDSIADLVCPVENVECGAELLTCNGECP